MEKVWRSADRAVNWSSEFFGTLCNYIILFITSIVFYEVFARYVFKEPTIWVTETSQYLLPFICFMGASYCLKEDGHINVDVLVHHYPPRAIEISKLVTNLLTLVFALVLGWQGYLFWEEALKGGFSSGGLFDVQLWIPYVVFPVGMLFLSLQLVSHIVRNIRKIKELNS